MVFGRAGQNHFDLSHVVGADELHWILAAVVDDVVVSSVDQDFFQRLSLEIQIPAAGRHLQFRDFGHDLHHFELAYLRVFAYVEDDPVALPADQGSGGHENLFDSDTGLEALVPHVERRSPEVDSPAFGSVAHEREVEGVFSRTRQVKKIFAGNLRDGRSGLPAFAVDCGYGHITHGLSRLRIRYGTLDTLVFLAGRP